MNANTEVIRRFYTAFQQRDAAMMVACYHPEVQFSDPVFPDLRGARAAAMWHMLAARGKDLRVQFGDVASEGDAGRAHWEAWYTFSGTRRPVHNVIEATFAFRDGRIVRHTDRFDLHRWAGQALGMPGRLLGWTPLLQNRIRAMAAQNLDEYVRTHAQADAGAGTGRG